MILITKINSSYYKLTNIDNNTLAKLSDKFSFVPDGYKFNPKFRLYGMKNSKIRLIKNDGTFPQGLLTLIQDDLKKMGAQYELSKEVKADIYPLTEFVKDHLTDELFKNYKLGDNPVILRDYQLEALKIAFEKRNGILNLSTGAGKCLGYNTKIKIRVTDDFYNFIEKMKGFNNEK